MYYSFSELVSPLLFYLFAFITLASALMVVLARNIFHCALFLILSLFGMAALFITLDAEFIAAVQVLVYIGAIAVLIVFAIMLTGRIADPAVRRTTRAYILGAFVGALLLFVLIYALMSITPLSPYAPETAANGSPTYTLGELLMTKYLLPFEVVSILLVAALVGAIVLAHGDKKASDAPPEGKR